MNPDSNHSDAASQSDAATLRSSAVLQESSEMMLVEKPSRSKKLAAARLEELTINKLKIHSIGLVGREKETEKLKSCLKSMMDQQAAEDNDETELNEETMTISKVKKELVFIKGFSGVGKTSLARTVKQELDSMEGGYYVEGKFDLNEDKDEPYSGIAKAYSELIQEMDTNDRFMLLEFGQQLVATLGSEVEPLTYLIPELELALGSYTTSSYTDGDIEGMQERWKYSFRVLTRLLTAYVKPLVIIIDDLQWADKASLDLIETLITDSQNVNPLMVIGCYRSNEVDEMSDLTKSIQSLEEKKSQFGFDIVSMEVESCGINEVNQMIMKMMDTDNEEGTRDLADLCFQKTLGNPFFVIEFMSMLQREDLVKFNIGTMKWSFDVSVIEEATFSTSNVAELLRLRMEQMPADVEILLQVAACLGPTFRVSILETLWKNLSYTQLEHTGLDDVPKLISFIESEMLIETLVGDKYRWVHDKVQEAALSLVKGKEVDLKFEMGKVLYFNLSAKELDNELFDVADLISNGKGTESVDFASLCLKAAKKAKRLSAFQSTARYVQTGIEMLPENKWTSQQPLTLELHTLGAQVQLALGHVEESSSHCNAVLSRNDIDVGHRIPLKLVETIKTVKGKPKDFYRHIGRMDDTNKTVTDVLERIHYSSYHTQEIFQMILCDCKGVQLTLQHGLCEHSGHCFAMLGFYATVLFSNFKDAAIFRELALSMQSHFGKPRACQTIFICHFYSLAWTVPIQNFASSSVFYDAYIRGMQNGEVDFAMWSIASHFVLVPISLGKPIDQILEVCPKIVAQMEEVSQTSQALTTKLYWQMLLNLREPQQAKDPLQLCGDVVTEYSDVEDDAHSLAFREYLECQLLLYYDHESAADRAIVFAGGLEKASPGNFHLMIEAFHRGVCLYVAARRTKLRKYKKHAKKIRNVMHKWKKAGIPNVVYYCTFLDAEDAALHGKHNEAEKGYKEAVQFVAKSGYLQHAALFNELYSDYLLRERGDKEEAKYRLQEALRYYKDWGALGKVEKLKESSLLA
ncbi:MAG: hypothetical protein SGBAC_004208 [Bacillariaceae sp.]